MNPTFEEYTKATKFARTRYRFGTFIQLVALIFLILLFLYTVTNIEEMKTNPIKYAEEKTGVICFYPLSNTNYVSDGNNTNIKER